MDTTRKVHSSRDAATRCRRLAFFLLSLSALALHASAEDEGSDVFKEADELVADVERIGKQLTEIVADRKQSFPQRFRAATLLGKMRYEPAIPTLLKYIDLEDPEVIITEGPVYHIGEALKLYGEAAIPSLIDDYVHPDATGTRDGALFSSIPYGEGEKVAIRYARGVAAESTDPTVRSWAEVLVRDLPKRDR